MDESTGPRVVRLTGLVATVVSAVAASIRCVGPLAAALLGVTSLGALVGLERYRPVFTVATLLFLAAAFYGTYRPRRQAACEPGSPCATLGPDRMARLNRTVLWVVAAVAIAVLTFPTWSGWVLG